MALLEATNTLLDFDTMQNSPVFLFSPIIPLSMPDEEASTPPWTAASPPGDDSTMTSSSTTSDNDYLFRPTNEDSSELTTLHPVSSSKVCDGSLSDDLSDNEDVADVTSGSDVIDSSPPNDVLKTTTKKQKSKTKQGENTTSKARKPRTAQGHKITASNNELPPCRVCADAASGLHYGVNACEACKKFFRRSLNRRRNFKCRGSGRCVIKGKKSSLCGHCRFQQCLALGMSRTAIKTGRYTQAKRAQDVQDVQRLASTDQQLDITDEEAASMVCALTTAHRDVVTNEAVPLSVMRGAAGRSTEEFHLKREVFGIQSDLTPQQFDEVFNETGLDVDGRKAQMQYVAQCLDIFIQGYVRFGTGVPGFSDLTSKDQASLLKLARPEIWLLGAYRGFLWEENAFYTPSHDCRTRSEVERLLGKGYADNAFHLSKTLQDMHLTHEEVIVLKAVCLTFSDRCDLEGKAEVEAVQWRMLRVLLHLLSRNHPEAPRLYHKVLDWTVGARNHTEWSRQGLSNTHFNDAIRTHVKLADLLLV